MEKFIIDTCTWIEFFHGRNGIKERIEEITPEQIGVSEVTLAELIYGAIKSSDYERHIKEPQRLRRDVTVYDISEVFEEYGRIRCELKKIRKNLDSEIGQFDILIGATALHYGLTVVTDNLKHFSLMPGVRCVNWQQH